MAPKIIASGQKTSAYLGHGNFVPHSQRKKGESYGGPAINQERVAGVTHRYDIVSSTPHFNEPVYRSWQS